MDLTSRAYIKAQCVLTPWVILEELDGTTPAKKARHEGTSRSAAVDVSSDGMYFYTYPPSLVFQFLIFLGADSGRAPSTKVLADAHALIAGGVPRDGPELAFRKVEGELRAELICNLHKIDYLVKHRTPLTTELRRVSSSLAAPINVEE